MQNEYLHTEFPVSPKHSSLSHDTRVVWDCCVYTYSAIQQKTFQSFQDLWSKHSRHQGSPVVYSRSTVVYVFINLIMIIIIWDQYFICSFCLNSGSTSVCYFILSQNHSSKNRGMAEDIQYSLFILVWNSSTCLIPLGDFRLYHLIFIALGISATKKSFWVIRGFPGCLLEG